jgi:hypothetical protein
MVKVLKLGLAALFAGALPSVLSAQEVLPSDSIQGTVNICDCFEYERGAINKPEISVEIGFNKDSVATLVMHWSPSVLEAERIAFDWGMLGMMDTEYELEFRNEQILNDTTLQAEYVVQGLEYQEFLQPERLTFGTLTFTYNRMIEGPSGRCGEVFIPIVGNKEDE